MKKSSLLCILWCFVLTLFPLTVLLLIVFPLSSGVDVFYDHRPNQNSEDIWVSKEPESYFSWSAYKAENWIEERDGFYGEISYNGLSYNIQVCFLNGAPEVEVYWVDKLLQEYYNINSTQTGVITQKQDALLFRAVCEFSDEKIVMTISRNSGGILDKQLDQLEYFRENKYISVN